MSKSESHSCVSCSFGSHTFNLKVMREKLPKDIFFSLKRTLEAGEKLQPGIASAVAHAMKEWALEHGATHYCHWFQPMTGSTAEKHDAFLSIDHDGVVIDRFSGDQLLQSEPDASSFPSGGMRSTFEARGYTAWDPGTPAFLIEGPQGRVLCIPSVFFSYHGDALDEKTPLLRSMDALNHSAVSMLHLLGDKSVRKVTTVVGSEQEYFLVDRGLFEQRTDLLLTGRTLLGALPPKGQQLEDHYFGAVPERVLEFMGEVEAELYRLGIPARTRHNEVAPHQFELAPLHEETSVAADHNLLIMETMRKAALRRGLALLLHEKPFAGINGSGKHNNWSMADSNGNNLLDPGRTPQDNLKFLVFLVATIKAVYRRASLLRAAIAGAGNDHRLGANEAPPAIMSVFVGAQLDRVLNAIENGEVTTSSEPLFLELGLSRLPKVSRDNTDRNRTSPFAFTGNKFEFRAVPSSIPISVPNAVLNTAVAEALDDLAAAIKSRQAGGLELDAAVMDVLRQEIRATRAIRFEGDNYSAEWQAEAARRGLPNHRTTAEALEAWRDEGARAMFLRYRVLTGAEIDARYQVRLEQYVKALEIEGRTLLNMVRTQVVPSCFAHQGKVAQAVAGLSALVGPLNLLPGMVESQGMVVRRLSSDITELLERTRALERALDGIHEAGDPQDCAHYCAFTLLGAMGAVREVADRLEGQVERSLWPFPTYLDLLFRL